MWIELIEKELINCSGGAGRDKCTFFAWLIDLFR